MAKDLFSAQSSAYARYRPTYPQELFDYVLSFVSERSSAWDCATGNGQAAQVLANYFKTVEATDISEAQLQKAVQRENIHYSLAAAEQTSFPDNSFDLITIATAYHWLDWSAFHKEATRVAKPDAVVAAWAYHIFYCSDSTITDVINHFYFETIHSYWDAERSHVEERYASVQFNFNPLPSKEFELSLKWNKEAFLGYLSSWSAVQKYTNAMGTSPLTLISERLQKAWPSADEKEFYFPLFMRIGRVTK